MEKIKQNPIVKKVGFNRIVLTFVLILMYILFSVTSKGFAGLPRILSCTEHYRSDREIDTTGRNYERYSK